MVFPSVDAATGYVEAPDVESGEYTPVFDSHGKPLEFGLADDGTWMRQASVSLEAIEDRKEDPAAAYRLVADYLRTLGTTDIASSLPGILDEGLKRLDPSEQQGWLGKRFYGRRSDRN